MCPLLPPLKMIHHAEGRVQLHVHRPAVGVLAIETVVEKLAAQVEGEAEVVAEVVFEEDADAEAGDDVERMNLRGEVFGRIGSGIFRIDFGGGKVIGNGAAEADIQLRVIGGVVLAQGVPVDDVIDENLRVPEGIGMKAVDIRRQERGARGIGEGHAHFVRVGEIVADDGLVVERVAVVPLVIAESPAIFGGQERSARLEMDEPAFPVLVGGDDRLGRQFHEAQQSKSQKEKVFAHRKDFFGVIIRLRRRACKADPRRMNPTSVSSQDKNSFFAVKMQKNKSRHPLVCRICRGGQGIFQNGILKTPSIG